MGVIILAVLVGIGGLILLSTAFLGSLILGPLGIVVSTVVAVLGFIQLYIAWGLYSGKNWARIIAMIFAVIDLIGIPVGTIVGVVILYYLTRANVKAFFSA
ncbi:MAG: hypothetical protein QW767_06790 [Thermoprotei archaeon]